MTCTTAALFKSNAIFLKTRLILVALASSGIIGLTFFSSESLALERELPPTAPPLTAPPAQNRAEFCEMRAEPGYFNRLAYDPQNHLAFRNSGGLLGRGVCWWHALFQRASFYLTIYRPELPKPSARLAQYIVHQIARGRDVVEIPGYRNMHEFSKDWQHLIQAKLNQWQKADGFLRFAWINGLHGDTQVPPYSMAWKIENLYEHVHIKQDVHWTMWQMEGISTHGLLVVDVKKTGEGADLETVDNNFVGQVTIYKYKNGSRSIKDIYGDMVPYLQRINDLHNFRYAAREYCSQASTPVVSDRIIDKVLRQPLNNDL